MNDNKTNLKETKEKLVVTITIWVFLVLILKEYFSSSSSDNGIGIFIAFSSFIGLFVLSYGLINLLNKKLQKDDLNLINLLLNINFILLGIKIFFFVIMINVTEPTFFVKFLGILLGFIMVIPILIFIYLFLIIINILTKKFKIFN